MLWKGKRLMKTYTQLMVREKQRNIFFIAGVTGMLPKFLQVVTQLISLMIFIRSHT